MIVALQAIRKSKASSSVPEYTTTFRMGGKVHHYHAVVRVRQGNSIRFREAEMEQLLANNMDEGRKVYRAIFETHRGHAPKFPIALGKFYANVPSRTSAARELTRV